MYALYYVSIYYHSSNSHERVLLTAADRDAARREVNEYIKAGGGSRGRASEPRFICKTDAQVWADL